MEVNKILPLKTYQSPEVETVEVTSEQLICSSRNANSVPDYEEEDFVW